jgi:hypothetical protein
MKDARADDVIEARRQSAHAAAVRSGLQDGREVAWSWPYAFGSAATAGARESGPKLDPTWTQVDGTEPLNC